MNATIDTLIARVNSSRHTLTAMPTWSAYPCMRQRCDGAKFGGPVVPSLGATRRAKQCSH